MKKILLFCVIVYFSLQKLYPQCNLSISVSPSVSCLSPKDTLRVSGADSASQLVWTLNGSIVYTSSHYQANGITVAGGNGNSNGANQLNFPGAVCLDNNGNIYVADFWNNRIQKFPPGSTSATNGVTVAGGNAYGNAANQLAGPYGVYVDSAGNLYVSDFYNDRIQKFPPGSSSATNGVTVAGGNGQGNAANQLYQPDGVYVDGSGNVYVSDEFNNRIQKFPAGSTSITNGITIAGGNGGGDSADQLAHPGGIYVDKSGAIYVADFGNNRIQKFPAGSTSMTNGTTVAGGNGYGVTGDQLWSPTGVFLDANSNLYVSDQMNNRIQKFAAGSTSTTYGVTVAGGIGLDSLSTGLASPAGLCVDQSGAIYVADYNYYRVQKFLPIGVSDDTSYIPTSGGVYSIIATGAANCLDTAVAIVYPEGIYKQSLSFCHSGSVVVGTHTYTNTGYYMDTLSGVATQGCDSIVLTSLTINPIPAISVLPAVSCLSIYDTLRVTGTNMDGPLIWTDQGSGINTVSPTYQSNGITVAGGNGAGTAANQLSDPSSVYLDASGNIYVADLNNNRIQKFPTGSTSATNGVTVAGGNGPGDSLNQFHWPNGLFVDNNKNIYVSDYANERILKFYSGSSSATRGAIVAGGHANGGNMNQFAPHGVYVDGSGNIYVSSFSFDFVLKFPAASTSATYGFIVAGGYGGGGDSAQQLNYPMDVYMDDSANLYVVDGGNNRIQKFPAGSIEGTDGVTVAGGNNAGTAANQLNNPTGIFVDRHGNIYVADYENNRIQEFPSGSTSATSGITVAGGNGQGDSANQLNHPSGVYVDEYGNLYVADDGNNRIQKFYLAPAGTYLPTAPGTYTAIIDGAGGCMDTAAAVIVYPSPNPTINRIDDTLSTQNYSSYQWMLNGQPIFGATTQNLVITQSGIYSVAVSNSSGCSDTSTPNEIYPTGLIAITDGWVHIYPNPSIGAIHISLSSLAHSLNIYDVTGRIIYQTSAISIETDLNLQNLAKGIYNLELSINNTIVRKSIILE